MGNPFINPKRILEDPRITNEHLGQSFREHITHDCDEVDAIRIVERAAVISAKDQVNKHEVR